MIIAIPSAEASLDSPVDTRLGRAARFILFDNVTGAWRAIDNQQGLNLPQGAGIQAAQTLAGEGVDILLAGHCGPKAFRALEAARIRVCTGAAGTVQEALDAWRSKRLQPASAADVDGHWL